MKRILSLILAATMFFGALPLSAYANVQYVDGVTEEMCSASYWADKYTDANEVIMTSDEIEKYNRFAVEASGTNLFDLEALATVIDAKKKRTSLINGIKEDFFDDYEGGILKRNYYVNGILLDKAYFDDYIDAITATGYDDEQFSVLYAICTKQGDTMSLPTDDVIGYNATDPDSEAQLGELKVGDPCIIKQKCVYNDTLFYYVDYDCLSGWINAENIAVCKDREEWLDSWKTDVSGKDFLVVACDKVITEKSLSVPSTSEVKLTMGSVLKLVPESDIPENIGERNSWNNYTVYLPARKDDGSYVKQPALISQRCRVSVGFLKMTERNIAEIAFSCLGNRYGWSGMLDAMDCSLYTRDVYRCFGLKIPRNTTWQRNVPNTKFDVTDMTDSQKQAFLEKMPLGALLYIPGHTMIYLGSKNGMGYVISDVGSLAEPEGEFVVKKTYSVIVNPLNARRKDGTSWLSNITAVVLPAHFDGHKAVLDYAVAPTCTQAGKSNGSHCAVCKEILKAQETVKATGHKPEKLPAIPATFKAKGKTQGVKCCVCGKIITPQKSTSKLVSPKLAKLIKGKKAFTAKWKKAKGIEGYIIRYSLNKNMKGAKTVKVKGTASKKTVKNLKSKKTYYVQIMAYTTINNKKVYSQRSAKKRVKIK